MRNYLWTRAMQWPVDYFDDTHTYQGTAQMSAIGRDDVDLQSEIQTTNDAFLATLPAGWTIEPSYPMDAMTICFTLDKENFMRIAQSFVQSFVQDAVANNPPYFPMVVNPEKSLRYTGWTDDKGVDRAPAPSDQPSDQRGKGKRGSKLKEMTIVQQLSQIYAILVVKPNPDPQLKKVLRDLLRVIQRLVAGTATQSEIDALMAELTPFI